jgi:hypothetical protein
MPILLGIFRSHFQKKSKIAVILSVAPYALRDIYRHVRGNCCLYHWVIRLSWRWSSPHLYFRHLCTRWYGVTLSRTVTFNPQSLESQVWQVLTDCITFYAHTLLVSIIFSGRVKAFETTRLLRQKNVRIYVQVCREILQNLYLQYICMCACPYP